MKFLKSALIASAIFMAMGCSQHEQLLNTESNVIAENSVKNSRGANNGVFWIDIVDHDGILHSFSEVDSKTLSDHVEEITTNVVSSSTRNDIYITDNYEAYRYGSKINTPSGFRPYLVRSAHEKEEILVGTSYKYRGRGRFSYYTTLIKNGVQQNCTYPSRSTTGRPMDYAMGKDGTDYLIVQDTWLYMNKNDQGFQRKVGRCTGVAVSQSTGTVILAANGRLYDFTNGSLKPIPEWNNIGKSARKIAGNEMSGAVGCFLIATDDGEIYIYIPYPNYNHFEKLDFSQTSINTRTIRDISIYSDDR